MDNREGIDRIKRRLAEIADTLWSAAGRAMSIEDRRALKQEERELLLEYTELLVHVPVSRCPICDTPLEVALDPGGLDGPWWWTTCPVDLPPHRACEHFQVFLGAFDLGNRVPEEATETVTLGPARPFIIERLLAMEGMQAVLSRMTMERGDQLYLVSYFSAEPVPPADLHQEFRREKFTLLDDDGEIVFAESKFDPWQFDFGPWVEQGKVSWISPGDDELGLHSGPPEPYLTVEGTELNQRVAYGALELREAPRGQDNTQFERP